MKPIKFHKLKENAIEPKRGTMFSCGYDFYAPHDMLIEAHTISKTMWLDIWAEMPGENYIKLENRSSMMAKHKISLYCSGVIDADYEQNIGVAFSNDSDEDYIIHRGDKICQGIIMRYYITDDDEAIEERVGGFGSTGK